MLRNLMLCCVLAVSLVVGVWVIATPARADATITVTTTQDTIDGDGLCSLREAIIAANDDSPFSDCPGGSGADTIEFDPGLPQPAVFVMTNTGSGEDGALTGDLDIAGTLTISGAGQDLIIIDGNDADRVFEVLGNAQATISGVTVRNGRMYQLGGAAKANRSSNRPLTQASRKWSKWLNPSSLQRIPTPLNRCWINHLQALSTIPLPMGSPNSLNLA